MHVSIVCQTTHIRCKYDDYVLFCRSWQPDQARKDPCLFFRAHQSRSRSFTRFLAKVITLLPQGNQTLPLKNPTEVQLLLEHVSFSKNWTVSSQTLVGRSVGISRICRIKKFQNQTVHGCRSFVKHARHTLSPTNMSFEAGCPLKLKQEKILAFSSVLPIPIVHTVFIAKVTMKEVCMDGGPPAKRSRLSPTGVERVTQTARRRTTSPHGKEKILRNKGRLPPGEEVTRSVYVRLII